MSIAELSVSTSARRPVVEEEWVDPLARQLGECELLLWGTIRALDHLDQVLDQSIQAIRARGLGPDEDGVDPVDGIPY